MVYIIKFIKNMFLNIKVCLYSIVGSVMYVFKSLGWVDVGVDFVVWV